MCCSNTCWCGAERTGVASSRFNSIEQNLSCGALRRTGGNGLLWKVASLSLRQGSDRTGIESMAKKTMDSGLAKDFLVEPRRVLPLAF